MESHRFDFSTTSKFIQSVEKRYGCRIEDIKDVSNCTITFESYWKENEKLAYDNTLTIHRKYPFFHCRKMYSEKSHDRMVWRGQLKGDDLREYELRGIKPDDKEILTHMIMMSVKVLIMGKLLDLFNERSTLKSCNMMIFRFEHSYISGIGRDEKLSLLRKNSDSERRKHRFSYDDVDPKLFTINGYNNKGSGLLEFGMNINKYMYDNPNYVKRMILMKNFDKNYPWVVKKDICDILGWLVDN